MYLLLYSPGVTPNFFLKLLLKYDRLKKPQFSAMERIFSSLVDSSLAAMFSLKSFRYVTNDTPMVFLKNRIKWDSENPQYEAISVMDMASL